MNRLPFVLPDFTRVQWVSPEVRKVWEGRIEKIKKAWIQVERARESCLQFVDPYDLPDLVKEMVGKGKVVIPLKAEGIGSSNYSNESKPVGNDGRFHYRVVITTPEKINSWIKSSDDDLVVGILLKYPECCTRFFRRYWIEEKFVDLTWPMIINDSNLANEVKNPQVLLFDQIPPENNILLRWIGVRLVSHLPCSFHCEETYKIAHQNIKELRELGFTKELNWIVELLCLPIKWSARGGIAEIVTPYFKIMSRTDATGEEYSIKLSGKRFEKGEEKIKIIDDWTDNGFPSRKVMEEAHEMIRMVGGNNIMGRVLDLGCGNGELLSHFPEIIPCGVDFSANKIAKCKERFPHGTFETSSIFNFTWVNWPNFDVIILMPGRLYENGASGTLIRKIKEKTNYLLIYIYKDWQEKGDIHKFYYEFFHDWNIVAGSTSCALLRK